MNITGKNRFQWLAENMHGSILDIGAKDQPVFDPNHEMFAIDLDGYKGRYTLGSAIADGLHLPFRDKSFSSVILGEILNYCLDPIALLKEALRVNISGIYYTVSYEEPPLWDPKHYPKATIQQLCEIYGVTPEQYEAQSKIGSFKPMPEALIQHNHPRRYYNADTLWADFEAAGAVGVTLNLICYDGWAFMAGRIH